MHFAQFEQRPHGTVRHFQFMRALAVLAALVWAAEAQTGGAGLRLPPVKTSIDIGGRSIVVTAWGEVFRSSAGLIGVTLTADLGSLQDNMTELLRSQLNRSDRCGERLSVEQASIEPWARPAF